MKNSSGMLLVAVGLLSVSSVAAANPESSPGVGFRLGATAGAATFTLLSPIGLEPFERTDGVGGIAAVRAGLQLSDAVGLYLEPRVWFGTFDEVGLTGLHLAGIFEFSMGQYASFAFGPAVGQNQIDDQTQALGGMVFRLGVDLARTRFERRGSHGLSLYIDAQPMFYTSDVPIEYESESLAEFPSIGTQASVAVTLAWERR